MIRSIVFICVALGIALIGLLFRASSNNAFFGAHYPWLFWLGIALTAGLLTLIAYQIYSLWRKLRGRVFGAKLALRLMAVFALMAVIPGGLVYAISVQFLNRSIDSWFDVPVDKALEGAVNLGKSVLESAQNDALRRARDVATRIAERPDEAEQMLLQQRAAFGADEIAVFEIDGTRVMRAGQSVAFGERPNLQELREVTQKNPIKVLESTADRVTHVRVMVVVPPPMAREGGVSPPPSPRALQWVQPIAKNLVADAESVVMGRNDYQQLSLQRGGLKRLFALTLTLAMVLTLFSAISLSFVLSERLSEPLSALAESTRAIARGDFSKLNPVKSRDEFGVLTQSFNTMTRQLAEASHVVERKQQELENANTYLESILGNLTSGVLTLDERGYVKTINKNAEEMLGLGRDAIDVKGLKLPDWGGLRDDLKVLVAEISAQLAIPRDRPWEHQIVFENAQGKRTLLVRGAKLPATIDSGLVLAFDDITGLIQAQRDAAWGEVARRLAHEIKNPLTPIQLSAERLQMKLAAKLPPAEQELLSRATQTIIAQVGALKGMVDDFSLYSRSARLAPAALSLNALVNEVLVLYESMKVQLRTELDATLPPLFADAALLRQVLHNLLQNAMDAMAGQPDATLTIRTGWDHAADGRVHLWVEDNGCGIAADVIGSVFEPYVTTKPKGTGLGLAIVKKIIEEHGGTTTLNNVVPHGVLVEIVLPINGPINEPIGTPNTVPEQEAQSPVS